MCLASPARPPPLPSQPAALTMDPQARREDTPSVASLLLELAASDDLPAFRSAVEAGAPIDAAAPWYGRWSAPHKSVLMGYQPRTPLMVAALYGSQDVLRYILTREATGASAAASAVDVNRSIGTDSATALHCAAAGGSSASLQAVRLLLAASADINAADASGRRPVDLLPRRGTLQKPRVSVLDAALRGGAIPDDLIEDDSSSTTSSTSSPATPKHHPLSSTTPSEKKEYPVDATLPDINSGIYGTDDFRMYAFKVKPCSRAYSHDWTECPFVHPGENARRRDPRKFHYSCVPCPDFRKAGACRNGDACEYAHGVFESWLHPAQYRTRLCKDETGCNRRVCFFAHKPEELRPAAYHTAGATGSPGSLVSSPRAGVSLPPLDLGAAAASLLMSQQQQQQQSGAAPMSPSAVSSSAALAAAVWLNQTGSLVTTPTSQFPSSRLKTGLSARDMDLDFDLLSALDAQQQLFQKKQQHQQQQHQQLLDELAGNLSPPNGWSNSLASSLVAASRGTDYSDVFGSLDTSPMLPSLKSLSFKQSSATASSMGPQYQSPPTPAQKHQHLLSGYGAPPPSSPSSRSSSAFGHDHSIATALMNSKASAFAKRSQSFIDRGAITRLSSPGLSSPNLPPAMPSLSDWGSPDGKLDWGIQGEELNKLRKSASFGFRSNGTRMGAAAAAAAAAHAPFPDMPDEPDVSWVQSLVKDAPPSMDHNKLKKQHQQQQHFHLNSGAGEFHPSGGDKFAAAWADQLYMEQEQMVA